MSDSVTILANFFRKIAVQRHLIWNFVVRDLKSRYVGSFMGFFWSVIHPLVLLISYTFVFSIIFNIRPGVGATDNFALFAFCGILPWLYFQDTVQRSCNSVIDQSNLIKRTLFPAEILPVTIALANLVTHLTGFAVLVVVLVVSGLAGPAILLVPVFLGLLLLLAVGLGWLVAALQVFLRDTSQVLSVIMVFWFWFTPVFYQVKDVPPAYQFWIKMNPLTHVVQGYRTALLENRMPDASSLGLLAAFACLAFLLGGFVFRNTKREFVDVL